MEIKQSAKKEWANYLKAYGIIMVVIGHAGAPADISKLIYLFHMPLFFFISGYFYKDEYIQNIWDFVKRRLKGLYLPSVIFGIGFVLLHNLFMDLNIYSDKMGYRGPSHYYTKEEIIAKSINVLKFKYSEEMAGVFWFFPALLFVFLIFITVSRGPALNSSMTVLSVVFSVFMGFVELLVAYIQALIFTLLSAVFIGLARVEPHARHK